MYPKFIELHKDKKLYSVNVDNVVAFGDGYVKTVDMDGHYTHVGESYAEIKQLIEDVGCLVHKADPRLDTEHPLTMDDLMTMEGEPVWNSNMCVWMLVKSVDELYATMMWASGNVSEYIADDLERYPVYRMKR